MKRIVSKAAPKKSKVVTKKKENKLVIEKVKIDITKTLFECKCGNSVQVDTLSHVFKESTVNVPICLLCHSIRTQKRNIIDDSGRINRFMEKYNLKE